jgi:hypothetical protein
MLNLLLIIIFETHAHIHTHKHTVLHLPLLTIKGAFTCGDTIIQSFYIMAYQIMFKFVRLCMRMHTQVCIKLFTHELYSY